MKKSSILLALPAVLLLLGATTALHAQFSPAPVDGPSFAFTTEKPLNEQIRLTVKANRNNIWIDLNGDKTFQEGEQIERDALKGYEIQSQSLTLYGDCSYIGCRNNQIKSVDISNMPNLQEFYCDGNPLTTDLVIADMPKLQQLGCYNNALTSLTLRNLPVLDKLYCYENKLERLEFAGVPNLTTLSCYGNNLKSLSLDQTTKIRTLSASDNELTELDLSALPLLMNVTCYGNLMTQEGMQKLVESLPTPVAGILIPYNPKKKDGDKNVCTAAQVAIAKSKNWQVMTPDGKEFQGLNAPDLPSVAPTDGARLVFSTTKAVGEPIKITVHVLNSNAWIDLNGDGKYQEGEKLELSNVKEYPVQKQTMSIYGDVTVFNCIRNSISALDITHSPNLKELVCYDNQISSIDLSKTPELLRLNCAYNKLKSLDLSNLPKLEKLHCDLNELTSLDLSKLPNLTELFCSVNKLESLDLSKLPRLKGLYCAENQFTSLDISMLLELELLACYQNQIKEEAMQRIVDALPEKDKAGLFVPYNPSKEITDDNVCTKEQVLVAREKKWIVLDPDGKEFNGIQALEDITASWLPITLVVKEGVLCISGFEAGTPIVVYTLDGSKVYAAIATELEASIALPAGNYVLRIGNYSAKVTMP